MPTKFLNQRTWVWIMGVMGIVGSSFSLAETLDSGVTRSSGHTNTGIQVIPVLKGEIRPRSKDGFSQAIGKIGGCTATVVSPPDSALTALVFAAHCGGAPTFEIEGKRIGGFTCMSNKCFTNPGDPDCRRGSGQISTSESTDNDVGICFSKQKVNNGTYGCITPQSKHRAQPGEKLRVFGFGNPEFQKPQVSTLLNGITQIQGIQPGGAMIAQGTATVTPGDSGGPVTLSNFVDSNLPNSSSSFPIIGINSKYLSLGQQGEFSAFTPFTPENMKFFARAIAKVRDDSGLEPKVCGVNQGTSPLLADSLKPAPSNSNPDTTPRAESREDFKIGLTLKANSGNSQGIEVAKIASNAATKDAIQPGDRILGIDGERLNSAEQFVSVFNSKKKDKSVKSVVLNVLSGGGILRRVRLALPR
jgi:PDZ domain/Trypsin